RRRHTRFSRDWSSDVCSSDLVGTFGLSDLVFCFFSDFLVFLRRCYRFLGFFLRLFFNFLFFLGNLLYHWALGRLCRNNRLGGFKIGRASCRERVWIMGDGGSI